VAYLTANRSEGKLNFEKLRQSCITSLNFIKNRMHASCCVWNYKPVEKHSTLVHKISV